MSAATVKGKTLAWEELSEAQVKGTLIRRDLDASGTKDELVKRARKSINLHEENAAKPEDDLDYFLKRSRMYHGHNLALCLRTIVISPFNTEVLACDSFHKWVEEATACRMGKNADGKSGVLLKFKYTKQGDAAYLELKSLLAPYNITVCHPKHPNIEKDRDEVLDILNEPLTVYPLQAVSSDRVGLARRTVLLEKVPTSLLAEERLAPYFPEAIGLNIYPNYNKPDTGIVVLEFETEQDVNSFLELEKQTIAIEGEIIVPKKYTTASHKYLRMFLKTKKETKVELDDETRVDMCKEFSRKVEIIRAIIDGDEHCGQDKLDACDKAGEHFSDLKRTLSVDTQRRIEARELKMPEPEEFMLQDTTEALQKAAEKGITQKGPKVAQKRVLPKVEPVSEDEPKVTKKYILPKLKPLPARSTTTKPLESAQKTASDKPMRGKPTTKPSAFTKKTGAVKPTAVSRKPPAKVKSLMDTIVYKDPQVKPLFPKPRGLLGDTPIEMQRAAFRNPTSLSPRQSERWQDADQKPFPQEREQLLEQQRSWPDNGSLALGREQFREPTTRRLALGAGSLPDDRTELRGTAKQIPSQSLSSHVTHREDFKEAAAKISALGLPPEEATSLMDDLTLVFVSRLEKLKKNKLEAQESVTRFYEGADVNADIASSKEDLMPVSHSFSDGDSVIGGGFNRESLMPDSRSFREGGSAVGVGVSRESLMPSSRSFRDEGSTVGGGVSQGSLIPDSRSFRDGASAVGGGVSRESIMPDNRSFRDGGSAVGGGVSRETLMPDNHSFRDGGSAVGGRVSRESLMPGSRNFRDGDSSFGSGLKRVSLMPGSRNIRDGDSAVSGGVSRESLMPDSRSFRDGGSPVGGRVSRESLMPQNRSTFREENHGFSRDFMLSSGDLGEAVVGSGFSREKLRPNSGGFRSEEMDSDTNRLRRDDFIAGGRRFGTEDSSLQKGAPLSGRAAFMGEKDEVVRRGVPALERDNFPARGASLSRGSFLGDREEVVGGSSSGGARMPNKPHYYDIQADSRLERGSLAGIGSGTSRTGIGSASGTGMETGFYKSSHLTRGGLPRSTHLF